MPDSFFITTAIDYTNGSPHIGHAYEKVLADVLARYHRLKGDRVFFLTGVDQHGQKVQQSAEKQGVAPQQFVDEVTAKFSALWEKLDVHYDGWAATTAPSHKDCVRAILQRLWDEKDPATGESRWIYRKSEGGWYSVRQEQFLTDKERGADGEFGPDWQPVEFREEENFYFRLMPHKQWLLEFIDARSAAGKPFVVPDFRVAELRNAVEKLEGDLCISRPATRLQWGIPFPESFGAGFVTYVWFDALVNYLSFAPRGEEGGRMKRSEQNEEVASSSAVAGQSPLSFILHPSPFPPALHVIGKDILIPAHGVYWPIMLKALGFADDAMPALLVHGWWNIKTKTGESEKMSKSLGNVVDPDALADQYGVEALRYYLMSDIATGRDADFSEERLIQRYNSDLANSLGNLLNRTLNMAIKYRQGALPERANYAPLMLLVEVGHYTDVPGVRPRAGAIEKHGDDRVQLAGMLYHFLEEMNVTLDRYRKGFLDWNPADALAVALGISAWCNGLIEKAAPWQLAKDEARRGDVDAVLYTLAESLRIIAILLYPVLPRAAHGIFDQLAWKLADSGRSQRFSLEDAKWGGLPDGHILGKPTPLFPRIEAPPAS